MTTSKELRTDLVRLRAAIGKARRRGDVEGVSGLLEQYGRVKVAEDETRCTEEWVAAKARVAAAAPVPVSGWGRVVGMRWGSGMGRRIYDPGAAFVDPMRSGSVLENLGRTYERGRGPWGR